MSPPTILRHIHLPGTTPFSLAQALQSHFVHQHLTHKALISSPSPPPTPPLTPPPTILTFTPTPVYTTGRREHSLPTPSQIALLKAPFETERVAHIDRKPTLKKHTEYAEVVQTLRGGQTTFHGPGQLVVYPILDLKTSFPKWKKGINVRCYVHLLERATINTLAAWELKGVRTENPGVWEVGGERKIAALGVHLRRNVSSYGVGLNISTDLRWFERIVACGLVGKGVTSMVQMGVEDGTWAKSADDRKMSGRWGARLKVIFEKELDAGAVQELDDKYEIGADGRWSSKVKTGKQLRMRLKPNVVGRAWVKEFARGLYGEGGEEKVTKVKLEDLEELENVEDEELRKFVASKRGKRPGDEPDAMEVLRRSL